MDDKLQIEEDTRMSLLKNRMRVDLVCAETGRPRDYVLSVKRRFWRDMGRNHPAITDTVGYMIACYEQDIYEIESSLLKLQDRDQIWVCSICSTEVSDTLIVVGDDQGFCSRCNVVVTKLSFEKDLITARKQSLMKQLGDTRREMLDVLARVLQRTQTPEVLPPQKREIPLKTIPGIDGAKLNNDILTMKPMDRMRLVQDLKNELIKLRDDIRRNEETGQADSSAP